MDAPSPMLVSVLRPLRAERTLRDLVAAIRLSRDATGLVCMRIGPRCP